MIKRDLELVLWTLWTALLVLGLLATSGCVRSVTVCTTYDHALGRASWEQPARSNAGASVCAEVGPR